MIAISLSILSARFQNLWKLLHPLSAQIDFFHVDIMDGTMTPTASFDTKIVKELKDISSVPQEIHLYVHDPMKTIEDLNDCEVERILVDYRTLQRISQSHSFEAQANIGLYVTATDNIHFFNPSLLNLVSIVNVVSVKSLQAGQPISWRLVDRLIYFHRIREEQDSDYLLSVDGGVNLKTIRSLLTYPIDQVVVGSGILNSPYPLQSLIELKQVLRCADES